MLARQCVQFARRLVSNRGLHGTQTRCGAAADEMHVPTGLDRRILVWVKKYGAREDIPRTVPVMMMAQARDRFRVRMMWYIMGMSVVAALGVGLVSKKAHNRGESAQEANMEWHRKYNDGSAHAPQTELEKKH